tara:strand:+ start:1386 stop:1772 length:387 start_codon:yes stop_codon:yes gene_type:complete
MGVEKLVEINNMQMTSGFNLFTCDENYMSHESVKEKMDALYDKNPDIWNNSNNFGAIEQISTDPSVTTLTMQFGRTVLTAFANQSISDIVKNAQAAKDNKQIVYDLTDVSGMDAYEQKLGQVLGIKPV